MNSTNINMRGLYRKYRTKTKIMNKYLIDLGKTTIEKIKLRIAYLEGILEYNIWADYVPNGNNICNYYEDELEKLKNYIIRQSKKHES